MSIQPPQLDRQNCVGVMGMFTVRPNNLSSENIHRLNRGVNIIDEPLYLCHKGQAAGAEDILGLDREITLQTARERFEAPMWDLIGQLEATLADLARVKHIDLDDPRAIGSVLNNALPDAALAAKLPDQGMEVAYFNDGQSNKVTASLDDKRISFEVHLCGPRGGTSKSSHQFAGKDIEREPSLPGFVVEAPPGLLFFIGLHLRGTGASVARAFLKFADGIDQRMIEIHRAAPAAGAGVVVDVPVDGPAGAKLTIKKTKGEEKENGSTTDKWGDAAPSSK